MALDLEIRSVGLIGQEHDIAFKVWIGLQAWQPLPRASLEQTNAKWDFQPIEPRKVVGIARYHAFSLVNLKHDLIDRTGEGIETLRIAICAPIEEAGYSEFGIGWKTAA